MKRHGNLWGQITNLDNIKAAHRFARRGKSFYTEVKMVDSDLDWYAKKFKSACKTIRTKTPSDRSRLMAYKGWCRPVNAKKLWRQNTAPLLKLFPKQLRATI